MELICKKTKELCRSSRFNVTCLGEIIVSGKDWQDSDFISNYDVILPGGRVKDLVQAFRDKDVLPNNMNTSFSIPQSDKARERGFND